MAIGHRQRLCFVLTLVLFIRGHQGFFIKHSSSGLCVQSASKYIKRGNDDASNILHRYGPIYLVHFYNTCLHPDAQFHFLEPFSVIYNIGKNGTFLARTPPKFGSVFNIYHSPHPRVASSFIYKKKFAMEQTNAGTLKLENGYCVTPVKPGTSSPIIPKNGDYVYQTKTHDKEEQKVTFGQVTKEGENMTNVHCSRHQVMKVVMAEYGGFNDGKIFNYKNDADCSLPSANIVKGQCDSKTSCNMNVKSNLFKNDPCPGKEKQLYMEYVCVDSLTTPITDVSKVRLSKSKLPNEGFIEIFDGSKWRKVDDKNWDKRKQTPLCQHLGYNDTKSNNILQNISSGGIATGYLYCSGQQPSTLACSAYLYSSTLTEKIKIPYVKCMY